MRRKTVDLRQSWIDPARQGKGGPTISSSESAVETGNSVHWTVKSNHRLRTGAFLNVFASVSFHVWDRGYGPVFWVPVALLLLVYPHLVFWRARRAANSQQAELDNLVVDSVLLGALAAVLQFPLWLSFNVFTACAVNNTISRGSKGALLTTTAFLGGAAIPVALLGFHLSPETRWPVTLLCVSGIVAYMIGIGMAAYGRNQQLRKTREALRAGEHALKLHLAELEEAMAKVKLLEGIIPICMYCKKIRDDRDSWQQMERYITEHSAALFSHGICPDCVSRFEADFAADSANVKVLSGAEAKV